MKNLFEKLVKENKENIVKYKDELKKAGFTSSDIQECMDIYSLANDIMFDDLSKGVCENNEVSYINGYSDGLYSGAKMQLQEIIDKLIRYKVEKVITNEFTANKFIDSAIFSTARSLYTAEVVKSEIISVSSGYDENIAVGGKGYYIVARKHRFYSDYEYLKVDCNGLHEDYEPTKAELKLFE